MFKFIVSYFKTTSLRECNGVTVVQKETPEPPTAEEVKARLNKINTGKVHKVEITGIQKKD